MNLVPAARSAAASRLCCGGWLGVSRGFAVFAEPDGVAQLRQVTPRAGLQSMRAGAYAKRYGWCRQLRSRLELARALTTRVR